MSPATPSPTTQPAFRYHAFLSYSLAADGRLAPALQSALHAFAKPWYRLRARRVFRDQTGLAVTPELWSSIQLALARSDSFILLASPQAAASRWVQQEVEWWLAHRGPHRLFIVWTEGSLAWNPAASDFDWSRTNALPSCLATAFPQEPLHLDLRWAHHASHLSLRQPRFADAVARLAAAIHRRPLDDLIGEDIRHHQQTLRWLKFATTSLALFAFAASFAAWNAHRARRQSDRLEALRHSSELQSERVQRSQRQAAQSLQTASSNPSLALHFASLAISNAPTPEALRALRSALASLGPPRPFPDPNPSSTPIPASGATFARDSHQLLVWSGPDARLIQLSNGRTLAHFVGHSGDIRHLAPNPSGTRLCTVSPDDATARTWSLSEGTPLLTISRTNEPANAALWSPDGSRLLLLSDAATACLHDADSGRLIAELPPSDNLTLSLAIHDAAFSPDSRRIAKITGSQIALFDAASGTPLVSLDDHTRPVRSVTFSPDGAFLLSASDDGTLRLWHSAPGTIVRTLNADGPLSQARFSPDGRWMVARDSQRQLQVWNVDTASLVHRIEVESPPPQGPILYDVSPTSTCLLVANFDSPTARLFDLATGSRLADWPAAPSEIRTLSFSPDSLRVVIAGLQAPPQAFLCPACGTPDDLLRAAREALAIRTNQ